MSELADPLLGTVLDGRYRLTRFIAEGGMGRVYQAVQETLDRVVAVKLLKDQSGGSGEFQRRFFLEASLCARLHHPNTIRIFDYGCHQDQLFYIVMEYLEGRSVRQMLIDGGPFSPIEALHVVQQVCDALIEAHGSGLVHRDLKPSNLFSTQDGMGRERVRILDFGVVKQLEADIEITQVQSVVGSPQYMAPEQIRGEAVDGRADLYALGAILFQLLSGRVPFSGRDPMAVVMKHITEPVPAIAQVNPSALIPASVERIVYRAMAKSPDDRFQNALEMMETITKEMADLQGGQSSTVATALSEDLALHEMETGVLEDDVDCTLPDAPELNTQPIEKSLAQLEGVELDGYKAYIDLNCPYCYALFERLCRWNLAEQVEWRMVEHASHVLDGAFDLDQEQLLSNEVFEVHHRAPDIDLNLPRDRCQSTLATYLLAVIHRLFPEQVNQIRRSIYHALWQKGQNIGEVEVLTRLLIDHELPEQLLGMCEEPPEEFQSWQTQWERGDYDFSIPVLTHAPSGRVLIGLADQTSLAEFLLGDRMRVIDRTVCFYQRKPAILLCGWLNHVWPVLEDVKDKVEVIQAPTARKAAEMLSEHAAPELLMVEEGHVTGEQLESLGEQARSRSVPWLVVTQAPDPDKEIEALSAGAVEVLPIDGDGRIARARLSRILKDRFRLAAESRFAPLDSLTRLPTRRVFLERLEDEWSQAIKHRDRLHVVLLNLDGFKAYNRSHGYFCGDQVLVDLSRQFQRATASGRGHLARFSGNEFVLLLPGATDEKAEDVAQALQGLVQDLKIENRATDGGQWLSASVGVKGMNPTDSDSIYALLDGAHKNLQSRRAAR